MSYGLLSLVDDAVALAKLAAVSTKGSVGIVIDDTAVTPQYVTGLKPERELPIIWNIAKGSLVNKAIIGAGLLTAGFFLGPAAPAAILPLLTIGGAYLCYEGYEKVSGHHGHDDAHDNAQHEADPAQIEKERTTGAIRTDFILSAEIMAIAFATNLAAPFALQAGALAIAGVLVTGGVYGVVGALVKADDLGLKLQSSKNTATRKIGRALMDGTPKLLNLLGIIGTGAMLWVGGGLVAHGLNAAGIPYIEQAMHYARHAVEHAVHVPYLGSTLAWLAEAGTAGIAGLAAGLITKPAFIGLEKISGPVMNGLKKITTPIRKVLRMTDGAPSPISQIRAHHPEVPLTEKAAHPETIATGHAQKKIAHENVMTPLPAMKFPVSSNRAVAPDVEKAFMGATAGVICPEAVMMIAAKNAAKLDL